MGAPSDQFLRIEYGGPLRSVSSHRIWGLPQISFFTYYGGLLMSFLSYYMGAPRIISLHTILRPPDHFLRLLYRGPLSDQFHCLLYGPPPQICFFACYRGSTSDFIFFTKNMGAHQISFSAYYMGDPSC